MLRQLPNLITVARIVLVVPLAWLILQQRYGEALAVLVVAALSDAIDGFLAKQFGWQSWIGGMLDPIADKLMLMASFVALGLAGALPAWLPVLVIGRDVVIVAGALAYHRLIGRFDAAPTVLSKLTTLVQIAFVVLELVRLAGLTAVPGALRDGALLAVVALTVASGADYVLTWGRRAWLARRGRR